MTVGKHSRQVVGLDIGSTKVSAVVGEVTPEGDLEIIGIGSRPSKGTRKGVIVDINSTVEAILKVVEDAEMMAGTRFDAVYVGIGGGQVDGLMTEVSMELAAKEVTQRETSASDRDGAVTDAIGSTRDVARHAD